MLHVVKLFTLSALGMLRLYRWSLVAGQQPFGRENEEFSHEQMEIADRNLLNKASPVMRG
ncbi:hypothetical protein N7495_001821 [Penicillium taxi]|uniref:uncharacterized protein n=1 Tax=Penicillium taxi TaxID=168475 RepID=UPI0025453A28|nr:uncharacterized protein N7495_001821 [Penicillium taxi]KAJ5909139.1 hypothetical protein N7495_001821 [Penicillium taxi]